MYVEWLLLLFQSRHTKVWKNRKKKKTRVTSDTKWDFATLLTDDLCEHPAIVQSEYRFLDLLQ